MHNTIEKGEINMKRTLSLFLIFLILLSSIPVFGASYSRRDEKSAEVLKDLGILVGGRDGDLMLDHYLKRQDLVVILSRLYGEEKNASMQLSKNKFKDIEDSHYKPYIYWAVNKGLIYGKDSDTFGYNDYTKVGELQSILLRALDYGSELTNESMVSKLANRLGIMDGVSADSSDYVTRGMMATMVYNALKCQVKGASYTLAEKLDISL